MTDTATPETTTGTENRQLIPAPVVSITPERERQARDIAARTDGDPFLVSDCEGELQVWRESALTHVRRDESGEIDMYSTPSSYRPTDQIIEIDLDTWAPGEDADDDQQRQDITDLVDARALIRPLLDEADRLRAELTASPRRAGTLRAAAAWFESQCPDEGGSLPLCMCHAAEPLRGLADAVDDVDRCNPSR